MQINDNDMQEVEYDHNLLSPLSTSEAVSPYSRSPRINKSISKSIAGPFKMNI